MPEVITPMLSAGLLGAVTLALFVTLALSTILMRRGDLGK